MMSFPLFLKNQFGLTEDHPVDNSPPYETDRPTHLEKECVSTHYLRTCELLNKYTDGGFPWHMLI